MKKLIGLRHFECPTKLDLLFFDEIRVFPEAVKDPVSPEIQANLRYLEQEGFISILPDFSIEELWEYTKEQGIKIKSLKKWSSVQLDAVSDNNTLILAEKLVRNFALAGYTSLQLWSLILNLADDIHAVPVSNRIPNLFPDLKGVIKSKKHHVLEIILKELPMPTEDVAFEQILDFRKDEDSRNKLKSLRHWWTNTLRKGELSPNEIGEELEFSLHKYEERMKVMKMKYQKSVFRILLTIPFDLIENLIKLKFSSAFNALFTFQDLRLKFIIEELSAPGRELAYISKAKDIFGR